MVVSRSTCMAAVFAAKMHCFVYSRPVTGRISLGAKEPRKSANASVKFDSWLA